jgi:dipeptidyl-peptidase-4
MLHELAHAVHDKFLGDSNSNVKTAYQQAMARKLYDKSLYIATNEHEFFAEASCAYLDRLEYFPKTREELKKHDPETFKLMEGVWGKAASAAALTSKANRPSDGSSEFNMDLPLA